RGGRGRGGELLLELAIQHGLRVSHRALVRGIEQQRLLMILIEYEYQYSNKQHQGLEGNLPVGADQERAPRFVHRLRRQIALHLALIRAEIRELQERSADQARPERVGVREAEREIEHL